MKSNCAAYSHADSIARIDEILEGAETSYEEVDSIPSRDRLTFTNGFYVQCTALFVDIRGSSQLPSQYKRPTLAKIYRTYISEAVAILNGNTDCREVNIHGDAVWGVFDTPYKADIDSAFSTAAQVRSLIDTLNCRYSRSGISPIRVGIGMDYGRALMIKAGYKGSSVNEVVWMGDVVNGASKLCGQAGTALSPTVMVSEVVYNNLKEDNKRLLHQVTWYPSVFGGEVVNVAMNEWINRNCT